MAQVSTLPFNKVVEYEDFADPELVAVIRDVFRPTFYSSLSSQLGRPSETFSASCC